MFCPVLIQDPRWGRFSEGTGEDSFLGSQIAKYMVIGYQGDDLPPYKAAIDAGAGSIMTSFNEIDCIPATASSRTDIKIPELQRRLLEALVATGKPIVLLVFNGRPLDLSWENKHVPSITRPVKELKAFQKVFLKAGESKQIIFKLSAEDLKFYNSNLEFVAEPGDFKVFVGNSSANTKSADFNLTK